MRNPGANRIVLALVVLAIAALTGCGSSSDETTGPADATTATPPASTSKTPAGGEAPVGVRADVCEGSAAQGGEVRVTGVSCDAALAVVAGWHKNDACFSPPNASRTSCRLGRYTCLGAATGRGLAVTCAGPGRSIAFVGKRPG